jgi:DNA-binding MarR family transcriptional regulator/GNAT superfamily N-acetyltransferase
MSLASTATVDACRKFNRFYTRQMGTLHEGLLTTKYSLTEARVLYELASRKQVTAAELAGDLRLDAGYLSRVLAKLRKSGLLTRKPAPHDSRQTLLGLSKRGGSEFAVLNERSNCEIRDMLKPLSPAKRRELLAAMRSIEFILTGQDASAKTHILRQHQAGDMGWVVHRHGVLYREEYGWDERFEALVARIVADFIDHYDPERERCWIAERDGEPIGCVFLVKHHEIPETAKLRLLLVEPSARGLGLGRNLVNQCSRFARQIGYKKITLWTNSVLTAARHIYQHEGYRLVREAPHHSFGKDLVEQTWELDLAW